jgi:capsular exopolysaccharide synthesis family protein
MGKYTDTLSRAEKEQGARDKAPPELDKTPIGPSVQRARYVGHVSVDSLIAKPDTVFAEQFRKIQGNVVYRNMSNPLRSILVTSCFPGEGKTKVALNLAGTLARALDYYAILIDADLHKKDLTLALGLGHTFGISDVLVQRATLEDALVPTDIEGLTILPAGADAPNPAELISSSRMKGLIEKLRKKHKNSFMIIDSTPMVATSEAPALSQMTDAAIVVILADKTRRDVVKRELSAINPEKILGVVLNRAEFETSDYYDKYYKGYYGKKKK